MGFPGHTGEDPGCHPDLESFLQCRQDADLGFQIERVRQGRMPGLILDRVAFPGEGTLEEDLVMGEDLDGSTQVVMPVDAERLGLVLRGQGIILPADGEDLH